MDLLNRYLHAVGEHLPAASKDDTLAELRANLLALIEDREETLGRPLTEDELADVLRSHGRPIVVAARYLPQRSLIGPEIFPFYWLTLRKSLPFVLLLYAGGQFARFFLQDHGSFDLGSAIRGLPSTLFIFWGFMTLAFVVLEYAGKHYCAGYAQSWNPRDLPRVEDGKPPSLAGGIADVTVSAVMLVWLLAIPTHPFLVLGPGVEYFKNQSIGLTPQWHTFYWQIVGLLTAQLVLKAVMIAVRRSGTWRKVIDLVVHALGIGILAVMVRAQIYFVPAKGFSPMPTDALNAINHSVYLGFRIVLVITILKFLWDLWALVRDTWVVRANSRVVV